MSRILVLTIVFVLLPATAHAAEQFALVAENAWLYTEPTADAHKLRLATVRRSRGPGARVVRVVARRGSWRAVEAVINADATHCAPSFSISNLGLRLWVD